MEEKKPGFKNNPAIWSSTLYYAQGFPFALVRWLSNVYFKARGFDNVFIGNLSFLGIPWTFKFFWSPLIDLFSTKRKWVLTTELAMVFGIGLFAHFVSIKAETQLLVAVLFAIGVFSATHDIASDGLYLECLDKDTQAKFSGTIVAAYRLAMITVYSVLSVIAGKLSVNDQTHFGFAMAFAVGALIVGLIFAWHLYFLPVFVLKRAEGPKLVEFGEAFITFCKLPGVHVAVLFAILFKLGDALLFGMSSPFILDAGMSVAQLGLISGTIGTIASISGSMLGGFFISKFSLRRGLWVFGLIQNLAIPIYAFVAWYFNVQQTSPPVSRDLSVAEMAILVSAIIVEQLAAGFGTAAYSNFLMRQPNPKYKASHYAILTGLMSLTTMMGGWISGHGSKAYGYTVFFFIAFAASIPSLVLLPFVARRPECQ